MKIYIDHKLQKGAYVGYYIEETKMESGRRIVFGLILIPKKIIVEL